MKIGRLSPDHERGLRTALAGLALAFSIAGPASAQGSGRPAELPPGEYAGVQYVDSKGCVFLRAGTDTETLWVPRVTAGGKPVCGYPPSGNRVPVVGEAGAGDGALAEPETAPAAADPIEAVDQPDDPPAAPAAAAPVETVVEPDDPPAAPTVDPDEAGSYVVALGSFGFPSNVAKATAAAEGLGYPVLTGQLKGGEVGLVTVFAGPFEGKSNAGKALEALHGVGYTDAILMRY
jgi:cell division septation protein DedD